jgi:hypothetical protein
MFTMILLLYLQQNLDVTLQSARLHGRYDNQAACEAAAVKLRGTLPVPQGYAAAWQDALCTRINRDVLVNQAAPLDLGKLLQARPPLECQSEGAWRRATADGAPGTGR